MSNKEQLFTEIIPSEEANLSGGYCGAGDLGKTEVNTEAVATVDIQGLDGDPSRSTARTYSDAYVDENRILGRASSVVRVVL